MRAIWKFPLKIVDEQTVSMPQGARLLCVQTQNGVPYLWAEVTVNSEARNELLTFHVYGTGHPMPEDPGTYIGTFQLPSLVFHVYQEPRDN